MARLAALATAVLVALAASGADGRTDAARGGQPAAPRILFTDVDAGPVRGGPAGLGVPVSIYGTGLGSDPRAVRVTIGGVPVARVLSLVSRPIGASQLGDTAPRRGITRVNLQADGRVRVLSPALGSGFGARP